MEISAASAYIIIFARNIHKVRDFLAIATITSLENGFYVEIHNFRYVEITKKQLSLCRDHEKNYVVITTKQLSLCRDHEKTRQKNYINAWPLRTSVLNPLYFSTCKCLIFNH